MGVCKLRWEGVKGRVCEGARACEGGRGYEGGRV